MAKSKIISDRQNTFFTNNKLTLGDSIPTSGTWNKGDIVISSVQNSGECAWICVEAGTPGTWEVFGAGSAGGGSLVSVNASVTVDNAVNEVPLSGLGVNVNPLKDKLITHFNSTHLLEGVDYEISADGSKIVKLGGGKWNESNSKDSMFAFELFKHVPNIDKGNVSFKTVVKRYELSVNQSTPTREVTIPLADFNSENDMLQVYKNGVLINNENDYTIDNVDIKIVKVGEGNWNETSINPYNFTFVILRNIDRVDQDSFIVNNENIQNGSLTLDKLHPSVSKSLSSKAVRLQNTVIVPKATNTVNIGINEYSKKYDILTVIKNGTVIVEGIDFEINVDSTAIVSKDGLWNTINDPNCSFTFFVTKNIAKPDEDYILDPLNIKDGSITKEKLHQSLVDEISNIDVTGQVKEYVGDKAGLQTTDKSSIVASINEVRTKVESGQNFKLTGDNGQGFGVTNGDANDCVGAGKIFIGENIANTPNQAVGVWWTIESYTTNESSKYGHQIATAWHSDERFIRNVRANIWSPWRSL